MRRAAHCAHAVLALALVLASDARADTPPGVWEQVKDPAASERYALHVAVREAMAMESQIRVPSLKHAPLERARMLLEQAHAATSPDVVLRFDLGEVCARLKRFDCAISVLKPALDMAPDHPAALDAHVALANAYAQMDRSVEERDAYERYLPRVTDERSRAIAVLNLAEAEMHLGNLTDAIAGYREAIRITSELPNVVELEDNTGALAVWGLAVALDRAGDVAGGAAQAKLATQLDPGMHIITPRDGGNVFFVPSYEVDWYLALGWSETAKQARDARAQAAAWLRAESFWRAYATSADPKDRWVTLARARRDRAHAQRVAAERRAGAAPAKAPADRTDTELTF